MLVGPAGAAEHGFERELRTLVEYLAKGVVWQALVAHRSRVMARAMLMLVFEALRPYVDGGVLKGIRLVEETRVLFRRSDDTDGAVRVVDLEDPELTAVGQIGWLTDTAHPDEVALMRRLVGAREEIAS